MSPFIVCIDGLIGAGKSTLLKQLSKDYKCFPEPVKEWTLLPHAYKNMLVHGSALQFQILFTQFIQKESFPNDKSLILVERCPWTSRNVFVPLILNDKLCYAYDWFYQWYHYDVNYFIYLDITPEDAFNRIYNRSEADNLITLNYLHRLYDSYKLNLLTKKSNVAIVKDGPPEQVEESVRKILTKISASIFQND